MPSKKKKYNARFPAGRIKKIMQSDEEVGKVAQAVPVIISRTLELFVESLLTKTLKITNSRNAKTLSTSHMKQCIMSEQRFDFLRELVRNIPDISVAEEAANYNEEDNQSSPEEHYPDSDTPFDLSMPSTSLKAGRQQYCQQSLASNGHNGGVQHLQQQDYPRNYLKRSMSTNPPSSIIRHTTALSQTNVDCIPAKLARCDSTAVPPQQLSSALVTPLVQQQQQQQQHPRLKHQSYSMPMMHMDNNKPNTNTPPKQQPTAIPAPIVNIDYTNKPVVKIDYSNLPITAANVQLDTAPLSAPANMASMGGNNTGFNFSTEPVINIDLSNIVASGATALPAAATISIGTPTTTPTSLTTLVSSSSSNNKTKTSSAKTAFATTTDQQSHNSKAVTTTSTMAEPLKSSTSSSSSVTAKATALAAAVAAATNMTTATTSTTKNDSYLDMDEDYDNI
ncbi:negative cofactor 2 alpha isoform 1-T2 [Cochliomyia hominivorax]